VNKEFFDEAPFGARIADRVTGFLGSWRFLILQTILVGLWIAGNAYLLSRPFDPYPFILLNLAFSTQAAYAAPLILLAQTRQAERDRMQSEQLERHREEVAAVATRREEALELLTNEVRANLEANTALTREIRDRLA
jgi:uncharacterized membrane protein